MRVCLITETYFPVIGGAETQTRATVAGLGPMGFEMRVVTRRSDPDFPAGETIDGAKVERLSPTGPGHLKKWALLLWLLPALLRRQPKDDVFLVSGYRVLGIAAVIAGRLRGGRVVLKADNSGEFSGEFFHAGAAKLGLGKVPWLVNAIVGVRNRILRKADAFVALSSEMQEELETRGVDPARIHRIPNSVDHERFRKSPGAPMPDARAELGLPEKGILVIFTGRLLRTKGVMDLAHVWADLVPAFPGAHLVIVGGGGGLMHDCEGELHAFLDGHDLRGSVTTTGYVRNVEDYLKVSDIFAFPTLDEAFGISLIEAMSAGLPVVATRVGGIKDIIDDEVDGLLIDPGDRSQLEAALRRLLEGPDLRTRLGSAAVETVNRRYTTTAVIRQYADLLKRLIRPPRD